MKLRLNYLLCFGFLLFCGAAQSQNSVSFTDSRASATTPYSYNYKLEPHFKASSVLGLPYGANPYYSLLGFRGWGDDSGGKGHELAFSNHGKIYWRSGYNDTGWENWRQLLVSDPDGNLSLNGNLYSDVSSNEGGSISFINQLKTDSQMAKRWSIYNMTGAYGNSLQFWSYNHDASIMGPRMVISDNGNVGIGTNTPNERLSVNGKIRAHEVKVETANWPDYVFEEDYKAVTLEALESYIKQHKHLPEIPSAKEAESKGIELGEMNKLLLKKIEELTLHLIDKDKQLKVQEKKNADYENRLQKLESTIR